MDSVMKGLMGQCPLQNFWARTAPGYDVGRLLLNARLAGYAGDIQSRNLSKNLLQVDLHKKLAHLSRFLVQVFFLVQISCTEYNAALKIIACKKLRGLIGRLYDSALPLPVGPPSPRHKTQQPPYRYATAHNFGHVHPSVLHAIELRCIR